MTLSVIIVNFKNAALLRLSLTSLHRALGARLDYEVIVVDSASSIETRNVVTHDCGDLFDHCHLIPFRENTGYTRGVNEGLRRAIGEHVLILNPDIVALPGSIETLIKYLREHPDVGLVGPMLLNFDTTRQDSCFRFYTPLVMALRRISIPFTQSIRNHFVMHDSDLTAPLPVDWMMGSSLMVSRAALEHVGHLDETLFLYLSEVDWARRFWENGQAVHYVPTARMYHYHQRQSKGRFGLLDIFFRKETRWHIKDAWNYFKKNGISGIRPETLSRYHQPALTN